MPARIRAAGLGCLLGLWLLWPAPCRSSPPDQPRERLPSRHWSYDELEELLVAGELDSLWVYSRPVARADAAARLLAAPPSASRDPRFRRLMREFALEVEELDSSRAVPYSGPAARWREGAGEIRIWPRARVGESRDLREPWRSDVLTEAGLQGEFLYRPRLLLYSDLLARKYEGSRAYADPLFTGTQITTLTEQAYASLAWAPLDVTLGRDRLRWGLGQTGSLLLGDAAPSMTLLQYDVRWHGVHATAMNSELESVRGEYLAGHRVEWDAGGRFHAAISEAARYQSHRFELLYASGLIPYTIVQRLLSADALGDTAVDLRNNVMASLEAAWRPGHGVQIGGTWLVDDLKRRSDQPNSRTAWQLSLLLTQPRRARPLTLRAEYTRIRNYLYSVFYGENYVQQGLSLAYPLGPDLARVSTRLSVDASRDVRCWLAADYLAKGEGRLGEFLDTSGFSDQPPPGELQGVVEKTLGVDAGVRGFVRDNLRLEATLGGRWVTEDQHVAGRARNQLVGALSADWRW